jgi:beta-alanine degradation protein BauB
MTDHRDPDALRRIVLAALPLLALEGTARAQDAAKVQPRAYRLVLENEHLRVLEFNSRPGMGVCGTGMHSHPAHLSVALSPARVRVRLPDDKTIEVENVLGDVWWNEAETHEVENISGRNVRALIIELKSGSGSA